MCERDTPISDNVAITAGTGTTIATDERTIASTTVQVQRVDEQGGTGVTTGQVTPTASAATLVAARETRKSVLVYNGTNLTVYVGPATVTTANGFQLPSGASLEVSTTALLQNIVSSVTGLTGFLSYVETYDS